MTRTPGGRRIASAVAAVVAVAACSGCGGGSSSARRGAVGPSPSATTEQPVTIAGFDYHPTQVRVKLGGTVTWTNQDSTQHTATANVGPSFDTGTLTRGSSKAMRFTTPGTIAYHCAFHPFMHGSVVVVR